MNRSASLALPLLPDSGMSVGDFASKVCARKDCPSLPNELYGHVRDAASQVSEKLGTVMVNESIAN